MDDIIKLNVGGQLFVTTRGTLCACSGSMLAIKFDKDTKFAQPTTCTTIMSSSDAVDGDRDDGNGDTEAAAAAVFIDRDPDTFKYILNYLRGRCNVDMFGLPSSSSMLQQLRADADYFGLNELKSYCERKLTPARNDSIPLSSSLLRLDFGLRKTMMMRN